MADEGTEETAPASPDPAGQQADEQTPAGGAVDEAVAEAPEGAAATDASAERSADAPAAESASSKLPAREQRALRRRLERSQRPPRSPQERDAERRERRAKKAVARRRRRQQEKAARAGAPKGAGTPPVEPPRSSPQVRLGTVVSAKPDKTITVRIDVARRHRRYEKIVRSTSTLHAHDEANEANEGDRVRVVECRPLSRTKRWKLEEILERAR